MRAPSIAPFAGMQGKGRTRTGAPMLTVWQRALTEIGTRRRQGRRRRAPAGAVRGGEVGEDGCGRAHARRRLRGRRRRVGTTRLRKQRRIGLCSMHSTTEVSPRWPARFPCEDSWVQSGCLAASKPASVCMGCCVSGLQCLGVACSFWLLQRLRLNAANVHRKRLVCKN